MPDAYIAAPIETDPQALLDDAVVLLQERIPGWEPNPGSLDTILLEAGAFMAAEGRDVASDVPPSILRWFGAKISGIPPTNSARATATSTWTAQDDAGYTIPVGTAVGLRAAGDDLIIFEVVRSVTIPPGSTVTAAGEVEIEAQDEGTAGNAFASGTALEIVDATVARWTAVLASDSGGGTEAEGDDTYLNRLTQELSLQTPRPILPRDFAILSKRVPPIDRALALDLYKPGPPYDITPEASDVEKCVTIAVVDANGLSVGDVVRGQAQTMLRSMREANFLAFVIDPTYTEIDADFTATAYAGFDPVDVELRAIAAVEAYLSPKDWGIPPFGEVRIWSLEDKVRLMEVSEVLNRVDGLWHVDTLQIRIHSGSWGTADITLAGVAPLPTTGDVTGVVSAP